LKQFLAHGLRFTKKVISDDN